METKGLGCAQILQTNLDLENVCFLQEEQASVREIKWDAYRKYSEDQLEAEQQRAAELELVVSALKQQLQETETHYKQKVGVSGFSFYSTC
jgi:primosomal replication protein N